MGLALAAGALLAVALLAPAEAAQEGRLAALEAEGEEMPTPRPLRHEHQSVRATRELLRGSNLATLERFFQKDKEISMEPYIVKRGDTLSAIAQKFGVPLAILLKANPSIKDASKLFPGQKLQIPRESSSGSGKRKINAAYYIVKRGDTLSAIAQKFEVPLASLLKANPSIKDASKLLVGQKLRIPAGTSQPLEQQPVPETCDRCKWVKMEFNGSHLTITYEESKVVAYLLGATSGLPAGAPRLKELIDGGRKDLNLNTNYAQPKYQTVEDAGPIPEAEYTLKLTKNMEYDKKNKGWGVGGWILHETFWNSLGGRYGFFLHHDGGHPGTAGCIGVKRGADMEKIKRLLIEAYNKGQREVTINVDY